MIEELKMVMETLGVATGAAKQFGIFWLAIELFKVVLAYSLGATAMFVFMKISYKILALVRENSFALSLRQIVSPESAYGAMTTSEKTAIIGVLKRGLKG